MPGGSTGTAANSGRPGRACGDVAWTSLATHTCPRPPPDGRGHLRLARQALAGAASPRDVQAPLALIGRDLPPGTMKPPSSPRWTRFFAVKALRTGLVWFLTPGWAVARLPGQVGSDSARGEPEWACFLGGHWQLVGLGWRALPAGTHSRPLAPPSGAGVARPPDGRLFVAQIGLAPAGELHRDGAVRASPGPMLRARRGEPDSLRRRRWRHR